MGRFAVLADPHGAVFAVIALVPEVARARREAGRGDRRVSGDLVYFQINVADGEKAKAFYGGLFGWEIGQGNVEGGFQFDGPSPHGGGFGGGETDSRPLVYFDVDTLEDGIAKVKELGGEAGEPTEGGRRPLRHLQGRPGRGVRPLRVRGGQGPDAG